MSQDDILKNPQNPARISLEESGRLINNKEGRPFEIYQARYEKLDPAEIAARCDVSYDPKKSEFELNFVGNRYAVSFPQFSIRTIAKNVQSDQLAVIGPAYILVIRYLLEGRAVPALGNYLTFREIPWGSVYNDNFTGRCIKRLAFSYGNSQDLFSEIMEAMNAKPIKGGGTAYELAFMDGLFIRYLLWAGDDEFPPSSQILFSDNFPSAFTAEDLAVIGDVTINSMKETEKFLTAAR